jgi:hypothetical protein
MASATQYTWNFTTLAAGSNISSNSGGVTVSTDGGTFKFLSTSGNQMLEVRAYETGSTSGAGKLSNAQVTLDNNGGSWGLGVKSTSDTSSPENITVDNANYDDILVLDSGMENFDWGSLNLSYITGTDSTPNLTYWTGNANNNGNSGTDFTKLCLTGSDCTTAPQGLISKNGFSAATTVNATTSSSGVQLATNNSGRYLVISGQLPESGGTEKFKVSSGGGVGYAPEPQSMALIGIGLLAMLGLRRRSSSKGVR